MKKIAWKELYKIAKEKNKNLVFLLSTDTVYGFHASIYDKKAQERIKGIKKRAKNKTFIVLISSLKNLEEFSVNLDERKSKFLKKIWPGAVTVILKIKAQKFKYLANKNSEIAFRIPKDKRLLRFIEKFGPIVSTSANLSGKDVLKYGKNLEKELNKVWKSEEIKNIDYGIESKKKDSQPSLILNFLR